MVRRNKKAVSSPCLGLIQPYVVYSVEYKLSVVVSPAYRIGDTAVVILR